MIEWILSSVTLLLAVLILRSILKGRIRAGLQYTLWSLVLLRLIIPFNFFNSPISVQNITKNASITQDIPEITFESPSSHFVPLSEQKQTEISVSPDYLSQENTYNNNTSTEDFSTEAKVTTTSSQPQQAISLSQICYRIWIIGMVVIGMSILLSNSIFFLRLMRSRKRITLTDFPLRVYTTRVVPTPCLVGFLCPAVYLTPEVAKDSTVMKYVLEHELTHFRHLDFIWSTLRSICLILHWYNPLVWIAVKLSRQDAELACDESTLKQLGSDHKSAYGETLIQLTCHLRLNRLFLNTTAMSSGKKALQERLTLLMSPPKKGIHKVLLLVITGILLFGFTFSGVITSAATITKISIPNLQTMIQKQANTKPTETDTSESTPSTEMTTDIVPAVPNDEVDTNISTPIVMNDATYNELTALFQHDGVPHHNWYLRTLTSYYTSPEQVNLRYLFWSGCNNARPSQEETSFALANDSEGNAQYADLMRVTESGMNEILNQYMGISLAQTTGTSAFATDLYCEKTGNYLLWRSEDVTRDVTFTGAVLLENGYVELYYYDTYMPDITGVVTLYKEANRWKIYSHQPT